MVKRIVASIIVIAVLMVSLVACGGSGSDDTSYTRASVLSDIAFSDVYLDKGETDTQMMDFAQCFLDYLLNRGISLKRISDYHTGGSKEKGYSDITGAYISARDCRNLRN